MSNIYEGLSPSENPQTYAHPTNEMGSKKNFCNISFAQFVADATVEVK